MQHSTLQCITVYNDTVQFSALQYSAVQCSVVQSESCIFSDLLKRHKLILYFISEITPAPILVSARGPLQSVSSLLLTLPHLEVTFCSTLSLLIPPSLHCLNVTQLTTRVFKNRPLRGEFPFLDPPTQGGTSTLHSTSPHSPAATRLLSQGQGPRWVEVHPDLCPTLRGPPGTDDQSPPPMIHTPTPSTAPLTPHTKVTLTSATGHSGSSLHPHPSHWLQEEVGSLQEFKLAVHSCFWIEVDNSDSLVSFSPLGF